MVFRVWNEPNIDFWTGEPKQASYFEPLRSHGTRAQGGEPKAPGRRAGHGCGGLGCALSGARGAEDVPVDFVSTHGYADDTVENLFHSTEDIPLDERVCRAIGKVHAEILNSARPALPLMWTEWNVPSFGERYHARDTTYVGAALASDIRQCDGLVDFMSYWTFDDVFEESGVVRESLLWRVRYDRWPAESRSPAYYRLRAAATAWETDAAGRTPADNVLVTLHSDGTLVAAAWNVVDPDRTGEPRTVHAAVPAPARIKSGRRVARGHDPTASIAGLCLNGQAAVSDTRAGSAV